MKRTTYTPEQRERLTKAIQRYQQVNNCTLKEASRAFKVDHTTAGKWITGRQQRS